MDMTQPTPPPVDEERDHDTIGQVREGAADRRYHPAHIVATLRAGKHVSNRSKLREQLLNGLR